MTTLQTNETMLHTNVYPTRAWGQRLVYLKPFLLATAATIVMAMLTCLLLIGTLRKLGLADAPPTAGLQAARSSNKTELDRFITKLTQTYPATLHTSAKDGYVTVWLQRGLVYRLHTLTSEQEVATTSAAALQNVLKQLDSHGMDYTFFKNTGTAVLITKGEWIITWGGILYLPQANVPF